MNDPANELFELRVLNGLHQGAALPLIGDQWLIGADDTLDLALHDAGVERRHCQLQRDGSLWRIDAAEGNPVDIEGHPLDELQPNAQFALGSVWLCLAPAEAPWPNLPVAVSVAAEGSERQADPPADSAGSRRSSLFTRGACVALGVLLGVAGSTWSLNSATLAPPPPKDAVNTAPAAAQARDPRKALGTSDAARVLKTMLSERMLGTVQVEQTADGLALTGSLKNENLQVYERMLQRFNQDHRLTFKLDDRVLGGKGGLPFAITQIIGGTHGHLVMADGRRMYIGDTLDGVRLVQIDNGRIQFDGEQQLEVRW